MGPTNMNHDPQRWENAFKASPRAYKSPDGSLMLSFTVTEDTDTILPMYPTTMYKVSGQMVSDIRMGFFSLKEDKVLGQLPYSDAASLLSPYVLEIRNPYVMVRGLSHKEMQDIITKGTAIGDRRQKLFDKAQANRDFAMLDHTDTETVSRIFESDRTRKITFEDMYFPSGFITSGDPFIFLRDLSNVSYLREEIPAGRYPMTLSVASSELTGPRIAGMKIQVSAKKAAEYKCAQFELKRDGIIIDLTDSFPLLSGYACFMDRLTVQSYAAFVQKWSDEHYGEDIQTSYFAPLFAESYERRPDLQRKGGDFIRFRIPGTEYEAVICSAGFSCRECRVFAGYSEDGSLTELVTLFADPALV